MTTDKTFSNQMPWTNTQVRNGPFPLERYSIFSTYSEASDYALSSPLSYEGQVIAVSSEHGQDVYVLDSLAADGLTHINLDGEQASALHQLVEDRTTKIKLLDGTTSSFNIVGELYPLTVDNWGKSSLVDVKLGTSITGIKDLSFYGCYKLSNIVVPNSVKQIGSHTFESCSSLLSIEIPNQVDKISYQLFYKCTSLSNIIIPNSVKTIENQAFNQCTSLPNIVLPGSINEIRTGAFAQCTSLSSIAIPSSIKYIGTATFSGCTSLTSIIVEDKTQTEAEALLANASVPVGCQIITYARSKDVEQVDTYLSSEISAKSAVYVKDPSVAEYVDGARVDELSVVKLTYDEYAEILNSAEGASPNTLYVLSNDGYIDVYGQQISNATMTDDLTPSEVATQHYVDTTLSGELSNYYTKSEISTNVNAIEDALSIAGLSQNTQLSDITLANVISVVFALAQKLGQ